MGAHRWLDAHVMDLYWHRRTGTGDTLHHLARPRAHFYNWEGFTSTNIRRGLWSQLLLVKL